MPPDGVFMNIDQLIDCLPINGRWELSKTKSPDPARRYCAGWSDYDKNGAVKNLTGYGETPNAAMKQLVVQISGPIIEGNE